ncbi:MAG: flagellar filament capping protein FliD [Arcobacteraceae bacterium]
MATDYSQLGSFATGGAAALNGELIQKLYDSESESRVNPLTTRLELIDTEATVISDINTKINELISTVGSFDLYTSGTNAFEQVTATANGTSALFDAADVSALKEGTTTVDIQQLAQKDVYQTSKFSDSTSLITGGQDSGDQITVNGTNFTTVGKSYDDLVTDINNSGLFYASVEQVSDTESRLVIKSKDVGEENALTITQTGVDLGLEDTSGVDEFGAANGSNANHILHAQNMKATVDGVAYDVSSNTITIDGNLKITAAEIGTSSVSIQSDTSSITPAVQEMANVYNELVLMITEELYSETPSVQDTSSLKSMLSDIKNMVYGEYGTSEESLLNYGFGFDEDGLLEIDTTVLNKAIIDDPDKLKDLFIGVAEKEGFGTALKSQLDTLNSYGGLFDSLESNMEARKLSLTSDKEDAIKDLDTKYDIMAAQFAAYATIISQMESSFGALAQIIASENSSD